MPGTCAFIKVARLLVAAIATATSPIFRSVRVICACLLTLSLARRPLRGRRQAERNVLARIIAAAYCYHNVLLSVREVGHRRAALRRRHPHFADLRARGLVVSAQHRAAR